MIQMGRDYDVQEEEMTRRWNLINEGKILRTKDCEYDNTSEGCRFGDECVDFHADMKQGD